MANNSRQLVNNYIRYIVFVFLLALPLTIILAFQLLPSRYQLHEGEPAPQTIKSPQQISYVSQLKTKQAISEAESRVGPVYSLYDPTLAKQQVDRTASAMAKITVIREDNGLSLSQKQEMLKGVAALKVSPQSAVLALSLQPQNWQTVISETIRGVSDSMRLRANPDQIASARERIYGKAMESLTSEEAALVADLASSFVRPNLEEDKAETEAARRAAKEGVAPVRIGLEKGEVMLRDGEIISGEHLEKLAAAGLLNPETKWEDILGVALLVTIVSLSLALYIFSFQPRLIEDGRRLLLLIVVIVGAILAAKLTVPGRELYAYLFPLAAAPMLLVTLLDVQTALVSTAVLSVLFGYVAGGSLELVVISLIGGLVGLIGTWKTSKVIGFFLAGLGVALANFGVILAYSFINQDNAQSLLLFAALSLINGGLAASFTVGTFTVLGHIFGITTSLQLMELAHPSNRLLRRLITDAPGTYHHSVIVGNMAERAADAIGADGLLVRVGSYYHDIGKVLRPGFFAENQLAGDNVHDRLEPRTSARFVAGHVSEGLVLAKKGRLPAKVRNFISEHHGTRLVSFFYQKACQQGDPLDIRDYCYPGPKPQSRETAIVMLADAVEAVVRSKRSHSIEEIDEAVERIVSERVAEGQLDESDLTLRDLKAIKESFGTVLQGVFHPRIEYPQAEEKALTASPIAIHKRR
ncbi:MAG: HDIG domain-containing protein [Dehalococcoidia bacterium]|nr:HDIG domain-containing protein [Dehalococcoidia bacterium]